MPDTHAVENTAGSSQRLMSELKVSGHLMTLEPGLFCILQTPARGADAATGLPGVRLTQAPGSRPDAVSIASFRQDGWLSGVGDAALVRVAGGPAQILVTIYQATDASEASAPNIQVMRLIEGLAPASLRPANDPAAAPSPRKPEPSPGPAVMELVAHIQERGDVGAMLGEWLGEAGSQRWIEGFGISPTAQVAPRDIEYQAVLGQGWLSPWVEGGQFCGSRAMALPLLGLRVRLRGAAAEQFDVLYAATFTDGARVGPVMNGEPCESDTLAAMEAFQVSLRPRQLLIQPVQGSTEAPSAAAVARNDADRAARAGSAASPRPVQRRTAPAKSGTPRKA